MHDIRESGSIGDRLSEKGYRMTPQRMMILSVIENSADHISAEEIYAQVANQYPHVNISTVYRTLELLKKLDMVYEIDLGEG
ncbi:MAG: transcriptional repressor, partial [Dehalococcoidales bacterium]|nr:transcriptional repressor [Dehalococcoidales bacterium]